MVGDTRESSARRGYDSRWKRARLGFLAKHPLCMECARFNHVTAATVVDHKVPHRGDMALFWDKSNWQSLCKSCHDRHKQRLEKSGRVAGCSADGIPIDPQHHWAKGRGG